MTDTPEDPGSEPDFAADIGPDPQAGLVEVLVAAGLDSDEVELARYASVIDEAIALAEVGQRTDCWTFCHRDHKPDNVLLHDDRLILTALTEAALSIAPPRCIGWLATMPTARPAKRTSEVTTDLP